MQFDLLTVHVQVCYDTTIRTKHRNEREGNTMTAKNINEAWTIANDIFNTDYMKDDAASLNAGYPVYWSTADGVNAWISDLGNRLEVNQDGKSINIWIEEDSEEEPEKNAEVKTEKTVRFIYKEIATKRGETVTTEANTDIVFGMNTNFYQLAIFEEEARKICKKALKAVKAGNTFTFEVWQSVHRWTGEHIETLSFDAWKAAPTWEQSEDYIYFRPDTRYTEEHRDMILTGKNIFKELSEYIG